MEKQQVADNRGNGSLPRFCGGISEPCLVCVEFASGCWRFGFISGLYQKNRYDNEIDSWINGSPNRQYHHARHSNIVLVAEG